MSAPLPDPDESPRHRRDWNGVSAIIAALIGLLALAVSGYTAWLQRQQVRAQVWPYLETGVSQSNRYVQLANKGVGPARIGSVQVFVDGKAQPDWAHVLAALGLTFEQAPLHSTVNGVVISPGNLIQQLVFRREEDFALFYPQYPRINLQVCYCSPLGECWLLDEREDDLARQRREVASCPRSPDDFTQ